jgi:hypothetical protein
MTRVKDRKEGDDPRSIDCGGDCLNCMSEAGDPECQGEVAAYLTNQFWQQFRWLVRETLDQVSADVEEATNLRYMIQDSTSCFHPGIPERGEKQRGCPNCHGPQRGGPELLTCTKCGWTVKTPYKHPCNCQGERDNADRWHEQGSAVCLKEVP